MGVKDKIARLDAPGPAPQAYALGRGQAPHPTRLRY